MSGADWDRLRRALHPLHAGVPTGEAWNAREIAALLPAGTPRRPAAVLVALVDRADDAHVLLTRRTDSLRHHAGQVAFPGGGIEDGDADPVAAALREAEEEVGLQGRWVEPLGYLDAFETISAFHVWPVVARVEPTYAAVLDPSEVAEAFEVPLRFLLDPASLREGELEFAGRRRLYPEFHWAGHRIWGATAAMLLNLRTRLAAVAP
jgi:8-oxo-dGTP pyrophosphatase MutT (NUDIX family)